MSDTEYEGWAVVELMGHRQRPGYVQEVEVAATKMLRIDIPSEPDDVTEIYGGAAIYCIRPTSEEVVKDMAKQYGDVRPIKPVEYQEPRQLPVDDGMYADQPEDDGIPI